MQEAGGTASPHWGLPCVQAPLASLTLWGRSYFRSKLAYGPTGVLYVVSTLLSCSPA